MNRQLIIILFAIAGMLPVSAQTVDDGGATAAHGAASEVHEETHADEEHGATHEERTYLGIPAWILKLVNMILFLGVLGWLLKGPISRAFSDRRQSIRTRLSEAEIRRERSERMSEEIQERLARVEGEIEAIRSRAEEEGRRQGEQIVEASVREAEKILTSARSEIDQRLSHARRELKAYAAELAIDRAHGLVESSIDERDKAAIFKQSVDRIREAK
jgi:F-type H+-transporting ATPase subunit b